MKSEGTKREKGAKCRGFHKKTQPRVGKKRHEPAEQSRKG